MAMEHKLWHMNWKFRYVSRLLREVAPHLAQSEEELDEKIRKKMMENHQLENRRCLYENDDVLVMHWISHFPNGTSDAVMMVHLKKDGLLWRTETGSTPLSKD